MSLLIAFVGPSARTGLAEAAAQRAIGAAHEQGFAQPQSLVWQGGSALWFATPGNPRGSGACAVQGSDFAASVGTAHWKGLAGQALLTRLLAEFDRPQDMPLRDLSGGFAMLFARQGQVWLFNDAVGLQKIYSSALGSILSTSLLVCRAALQQPQLNRLRAQEYVLLGANHATQTPLEGLQILDPTQALELRGGKAVLLHPAPAWRMPAAFKSPAEAVATLSDMIVGNFSSMLQAYGPSVGMALSGGFDSRLLLAALRHQGVAPHLYVYGHPDLDDVRIASAKAHELGLPIECIDKVSANAALPQLSPTLLRENLAFFDGLPVDGVFDRGTDRATRLAQVAGGMLNLNGGGGEIFRNFFYLPGRVYSANDLVGAFYSNWLPRAIANADERRAFTAATADGILTCIGFESGSNKLRSQVLSRSDVELVYTLFRLRWWMARNNTVAARHGAFMTPLVQPRLVELAAQVPVAWKTFGELEAAIITRLSPAVARGPSNYGFDFSQGPSAAHQRYIKATLFRPIGVRRFSARIRRLLGRNPTVSAPNEWLHAFRLPKVDWIDMAYLTEIPQFNRLCTLCALLE